MSNRCPSSRRAFLAASAAALVFPWRALAAAPTEPPDPLADVRPPRPFDDAVWVDGRWFWDGGSFRWVGGMWIAPLDGYAFIPGRWEEDPDGWRWRTGGWAQPGSSEIEVPFDVVGGELVVDREPPRIIVEQRPLPPSTYYVWSPGYWYWAGVVTGWVWIGGVWMQPPRPGLVWVGPHWVHRGTTWVFIYGGWGHGTRVIVPVHRHRRVVVVDHGHPHRHLHSKPRVVHRPPAGRPKPRARPRPRPAPQPAPHPTRSPSKKRKTKPKPRPAPKKPAKKKGKARKKR